MENILVSIVLTEVILLLIGYKWELNLKVVSISAIIIGLFVGLVISIVEAYFSMGLLSKLASSLILIVLISMSALMARFYRDPDRVPPKRENVVLSPADGSIKYIKHIEKGEIPFSSKGRENIKLSAPLTDILRNE